MKIVLEQSTDGTEDINITRTEATGKFMFEAFMALQMTIEEESGTTIEQLRVQWQKEMDIQDNK